MRRVILTMLCCCLGGLHPFGCAPPAPDPAPQEPDPLSEPLIAVPARPVAQPIPSAAADPEPCVVAIDGAVQKPGLYTLQAEARIWGLLEAAGGPTEGADLYDVNIAAPLRDGLSLHIPTLEESLAQAAQGIPRAINPPEYRCYGWRANAEGDGSTANTSAADSLVPINTASKERLESLPGIGPATADKILRYRDQQPFTSIDDLLNVNGIGPKKLADIRPLISLD